MLLRLGAPQTRCARVDVFGPDCEAGRRADVWPVGTAFGLAVKRAGYGSRGQRFSSVTTGESSFSPVPDGRLYASTVRPASRHVRERATGNHRGASSMAFLVVTTGLPRVALRLMKADRNCLVSSSGGPIPDFPLRLQTCERTHRIEGSRTHVGGPDRPDRVGEHERSVPSMALSISHRNTMPASCRQLQRDLKTHSLSCTAFMNGFRQCGFTGKSEMHPSECS